MTDTKHVDAFMQRIYLLIGLAAVAIIVPAAALVYYLDSRFDSIEADLGYAPPGEGAGAIQAVATLPWEPVQGQVVYVPAYSHVYHQSGQPQLLTITLSVRNTDRQHQIVLTSVRYFDTSGKEVKSHLEQPLQIGPLSATEFIVERNDKSGGSGASFLVEWSAGQPVTEPIIEAVMIDTSGNQGISFVRPGTVLEESHPQ